MAASCPRQACDVTKLMNLSSAIGGRQHLRFASLQLLPLFGLGHRILHCGVAGHTGLPDALLIQPAVNFRTAQRFVSQQRPDFLQRFTANSGVAAAGSPQIMQPHIRKTSTLAELEPALLYIFNMAGFAFRGKNKLALALCPVSPF